MKNLDIKTCQGFIIKEATLITNDHYYEICFNLTLLKPDNSLLKIKIFDGGQSCCETRYMTTDDDISSLIGNKLLEIKETEIPNNPIVNQITEKLMREDSGGNCHELSFVEVSTDKGFITLCTHNEHNGYYGGFYIMIVEDDQ